METRTTGTDQKIVPMLGTRGKPGEEDVCAIGTRATAGQKGYVGHKSIRGHKGGTLGKMCICLLGTCAHSSTTSEQCTKHTRVHTHTRTHTRADTHTHTHTHTHIHIHMRGRTQLWKARGEAGGDNTWVEGDVYLGHKGCSLQEPGPDVSLLLGRAAE